MTGSPRRIPDLSASTSETPLSRKSPVRRGFNVQHQSPFNAERTTAASPPARRAGRTDHLRDSPVKLRPTSARIARQAEGILTTLDTAGQTPFRATKRNIANGSPGYNQRATNRYAETNKENIPKRRKVVKFEDEQERDKETPSNGLERIVLDLQQQVQRLQRDHSTAISAMQEKLEAQSILIDKLLQERR